MQLVNDTCLNTQNRGNVSRDNTFLCHIAYRYCNKQYSVLFYTLESYLVLTIFETF
jgi:hypothetical protein